MNPSPSAAASSASHPPHPTHSTPALRTLPNSYIKIYKNGVLMGTAFENLLGFLPPASRPMPQVGARDGLDDGMLGYYPAISIFRGGTAEVNFGPNFWYPPPEYDAAGGAGAGTQSKTLRSVSERYKEQLAEDIVYDIIDEVDFWMQDGGGDANSAESNAKTEAVSLTPGRAEIKELVEDD
ncbi:hypothetical protein NQ176_g9249 [Zarea fungicola]|uniref:Uncharacterized protein n=1 Tax=Zarea fungicola TaxID=93591 RepID=A0ACC1MP51_9HYPO|nr:hypothetical protein NQ176_g9249 [Lecanicillium fungicola]